jgi:DNA polymerase III epsilon subunit-like protein
MCIYCNTKNYRKIYENHYAPIGKDNNGRSYDIHHISREILDVQGISIMEALKDFNECLKICDIVVGHNLSFDKRLIFVECFRHNVTQYFTEFKKTIGCYTPLLDISK